MQQATTVVSYSEQVSFFIMGLREILSLQIVQDWLSRLGDPSKDTISSDSKMSTLSYLIEISQ